MQISLAQDTISHQDIDTLCKWLKTYPRLTKGEQTILFEQEYAKTIGSKYAVFVNSGSSANLLMIAALIESMGLNYRQQKPKVVVPALSWITDISPVIQLGLQPILCDCNLRDLSVDLNNLETIFEKEKPVALLLVSVLGLVPNIRAIVDLCKKYDVILLEDNCESLGSTFNGKQLGTFGLMSSTSFYYGHIISTIEGGMIATDNFEIYEILKMLRSHGWNRDICDESKTKLNKEFNVSEFDAMYTFFITAFNVRSTDLQAFIGLLQLQKLKDIVEKRAINFNSYNKLVKNKYWKPQDATIENIVSNLGYPVIGLQRDKIVAALQENNVEVRPLISGSIGKQPFYKTRYSKRELYNCNLIDKFGFYLPNHPQLTMEQIEFICSIVNKYC